jgi:hypothetical protein
MYMVCDVGSAPSPVVPLLLLVSNSCDIPFLQFVHKNGVADCLHFADWWLNSVLGLANREDAEVC